MIDESALNIGPARQCVEKAEAPAFVQWKCAVSLDKQDTFVSVCQTGGNIGGNGRAAFTAPGRCDKYHAAAAVPVERQRGTEIGEPVRDIRLLLLPRHRPRSRIKHRYKAADLGAKDPFCLPGCSQGPAHGFARKRQCETSQKPQQRCADQKRRFARRRFRWRKRHGDDANVVGFKRPGFVEFFLAGQHLLVDSAFGFGFAFELAKLDQLGAEIAAFSLRIFQLARQRRLALPGFQKFGLRRRYHARRFRSDLAAHVVQLGVEARDLGMPAAEHRGLIGGLACQAHVFQTQRIQDAGLERRRNILASLGPGQAQLIDARARLAGLG